MITFRNVVGYLETIAEKHFQINSFHSGQLDEVDINKLGATDYIILYAEPGTVVVNKGVLTYNFSIFLPSQASSLSPHLAWPAAPASASR